MRSIRNNAVRNIGGIINPNLFIYSYIGTKQLIQDFYEEVTKSLEYISNLPHEKIPD